MILRDTFYIYIYKFMFENMLLSTLLCFILHCIIDIQAFSELCFIE
jgi:hypothetical protein